MTELKLWNPFDGDVTHINVRQFKWFDDLFDFKKSVGIVVVGGKGSGKSGWIGAAEELHYLMGYGVFDTLGSDADHENLGMSLSGDYRYPVIIIKPSYVNFELSEKFGNVKPFKGKYPPPGGWVKFFTEETDLSEVMECAENERRVILFDNASFVPQHYKQVLLKWFEEMPSLIRRFGRPYFVCGREYYKLMPVRGTVVKDKETNQIRELLKEFFNNLRHSKGSSFAVDFQRPTDFDKGTRDMMDIRCVRRMVNPEEMLKDLDCEWLPQQLYKEHLRKSGTPSYPMFNHYAPLIENLRPQEGYFIDKDNMYLKRINPLPGFHHLRTESEDIADFGMLITKDMKKMREVVFAGGLDWNRHHLKIISLVNDNFHSPVELYNEMAWERDMADLIKLMDYMCKTGELKGGQGSYEVAIGEIPERTLRKIVKEDSMPHYDVKKNQSKNIIDFLEYHKPEGLSRTDDILASIFLSDKSLNLDGGYAAFKVFPNNMFKWTYEVFCARVADARKAARIPVLAFEPQKIPKKYLARVVKVA